MNDSSFELGDVGVKSEFSYDEFGGWNLSSINEVMVFSLVFFSKVPEKRLFRVLRVILILVALEQGWGMLNLQHFMLREVW